MQPMMSVGITKIKSQINYMTYKTKSCWRSIDAHFQNQAESMSLPVWSIKAGYLSLMNVCNQSPNRWTKIKCQTLLTLRWCSFAEWGRECVVFSLASKCIIYLIYEHLHPIATHRFQDARQKIMDVPLILIFRMRQRAFYSCFWF